MKKRPICYIYYIIKNKRQSKTGQKKKSLEIKDNSPEIKASLLYQ